MDTLGVNEHGRLGPIEWATASRQLPGEAVSGDDALAVETADGAALFGVIDGLGHGEDAAVAATCAAEVLRGAAGASLDDLLRRCHRKLAATRGAAITLAKINFDADTLQWMGVGNVTANLLAKGPSGVDLRSARLTNGIVGYRITETPSAQEVAIRPGHLLVMATDGIIENHLDGIDFAAPANTLASRILSKFGKQTDDALVLVARHRGRVP